MQIIHLTFLRWLYLSSDSLSSVPPNYVRLLAFQVLGLCLPFCKFHIALAYDIFLVFTYTYF